MSVTIIGGVPRKRGAGYRTKQSLTQSTATSYQTVSLDTELTCLGMGTATGIARNLYSLASGAVEGMDKSILSTATGEAHLLITVGTATGMHVFTEADDYLLTRYEDGKWRILVSSATLASTT